MLLKRVNKKQLNVISKQSFLFAMFWVFSMTSIVASNSGKPQEVVPPKRITKLHPPMSPTVRQAHALYSTLYVDSPSGSQQRAQNQQQHIQGGYMSHLTPPPSSQSPQQQGGLVVPKPRRHAPIVELDQKKQHAQAAAASNNNGRSSKELERLEKLAKQVGKPIVTHNAQHLVVGAAPSSSSPLQHGGGIIGKTPPTRRINMTESFPDGSSKNTNFLSNGSVITTYTLKDGSTHTVVTPGDALPD